MNTGFTVPQFTGTDYDGAVVDNSIVDGKVWLASFIFTTCPGICPQVSAQMSVVNDHFKDNDNVRLVSFTVDPETDTPEVLQKYAVRYGAKPGKWHMINMPDAEIKDLANNGFKVGVPDNIMVHTPKVVLVDRTGKIRGYFEGDDVESIERCELAIKYLLGEQHGGS